MDNQTLIDRYAKLAVRVGVNVQEGQYVLVQGKLEHVPLMRAVAKEAYAAGARYVFASYYDDHVRRSMIENVADEDLTWTPPHLLTAMKFLDEVGGGANLHRRRCRASPDGRPRPSARRSGQDARSREREHVADQPAIDQLDDRGLS